MGGNFINYHITPTVNLVLIKIFFNSVILTPGAKFATEDIPNFYLVRLLKRPGYARIQLSNICNEIIKEYKLHEFTTVDSQIYIKVVKGIYSIPQARSLGHNLLKERFNKQDYFQSKSF